MILMELCGLVLEKTEIRGKFYLSAIFSSNQYRNLEINWLIEILIMMYMSLVQ